MLLTPKTQRGYRLLKRKELKNNKDVCGIQNNVRGLEKSVR